MMLSKIHRAAVSSRSRSSFSSVVLNYGYVTGGRNGGRNGSMSIISGELVSHNSSISRLDIGLGGLLRTYFPSIESGSGNVFINNKKAYYSTGLSNIISVNRRLFCTETPNKNTKEIPNKNNQQRSESKGHPRGIYFGYGGEENFRPIIRIRFTLMQAAAFFLLVIIGSALVFAFRPCDREEEKKV